MFKITRAGAETEVYGFKNGADGAYPYRLTFANGALYGTTEYGGGGNCSGIGGCGTVFKLTA